MKNVTKQNLKNITPGRQQTYNEIIAFLDTNWSAHPSDFQLDSIKQLDQAFNSVSNKVKTILVAGTNGKSLTIDFTAKLLKEENISVGTLTSPHILAYNERIALNNEPISNKAFTDLANDVINTASNLDLSITSHEILTMMALLYFHQNHVDVALLEVSQGGLCHPTNICHANIAAITRITCDDNTKNNAALEDILGIVKSNTHVISGDQSKVHLQKMAVVTQKAKAFWAMPIRKLSPLQYPFEQLHGRCAALAERIASIFVNEVLKKDTVASINTLVTKQKGQRGRPTLEAKRQAELNPKKTVEQFWKETTATLPGRFQLLDKEKPSLLLDTASNLDSFKNLLLGIRLLHYQRPLKGLILILGNNNPDLDIQEFMKALRYFFKKASGQVIVCPVNTIPGEKGSSSWDIEKITNDIKSMKIKARTAKSFKEAFESAKKTVDERHGLVVITGCTSIVSEYWNYKGIKKI